MNVYEIVTQEIIDQLERGEVIWQKPWSSNLPCNLVSQKQYRGLNVFTLATSGHDSRYWLTFNQCTQLGGKIKQGSKSRIVTFWNVGQEKLNPKTGKVSTPFLLRYYRVFNLNQTEGIKLSRAVFERNKISQFEANHAAETLAESMPNPPKFEQASEAWYAPSTDTVGLPSRTRFTSPGGYYATLFHELAHSTGHKSRLDRLPEQAMTFGQADYSKEELVAEMTSAFLCGMVGLDRETRTNTVAYLQNWIQVLKGDAKLILSAASQAQKAADYISRNAQEMEEKEAA